MGFAEIPVAQPSQPRFSQILGLRSLQLPCSISIPGMLLHAHTAPKIPKLSGKGQSKKRKRGGRMREQTNHINSNQSRPWEMITLKLFTPG